MQAPKDTVPRRFIYRHVPGKTDEDADADRIKLYDVVEWNEYFTEQYLKYTLVRKLLDSVFFKSITMIIIIIDAIVVGLETDEDLSQKYSTTFIAIEQCVLTYYALEIGIKWFYNFFIFWMDLWNVFDFTLIVSAVMVDRGEFIGGLRLLHIVRYAQEMYALTDFKFLRGMVIVSRGMLLALPPLIDILALLLLLLIILSTVAVTVLSELVPSHYGNFALALFKLFSALTNEVWSSIHYEVRKSTGSVLFYILLIFNLAVIFLVIFFVHGLLLATLHSNLELAIQEVEAEEKIRAEQKSKDKTEEFGTGKQHQKYNEMYSNISSESEAIRSPDIKTFWMEKLFRDKNYSQKNCEITDFKQLTMDKVANYLMILTALDENFQEYLIIRSDLERLVKVICDLQYSVPMDETVFDNYRYGRNKNKIKYTILNDEQRAKLLATREELERRKLIFTKLGDRQMNIDPISKMKDDRPEDVRYSIPT